jgi:hypothetical protein
MTGCLGSVLFPDAVEPVSSSIIIQSNDVTTVATFVLLCLLEH